MFSQYPLIICFSFLSWFPPKTILRMKGALASRGQTGSPHLQPLPHLGQSFSVSGPPSLGTVARDPSALQILQFHFSNLIIVFLFLWKITFGEKCRDVKEKKKSKAEGYYEIEKAKQSKFLKEKRQRKLL